MNDNDLQKVFIDIDIAYRNNDELNILYLMGGNYLWINNEIGIIKGFKNFSLRNLDKLLKMLKKENVKFNKFEIRN